MLTPVDQIVCSYYMVTMAPGARAIGLADRIGSIEKGEKADIIAFNLYSHPRWPLYLNNDSVYTFIVKNLASGQADFCLIDGKTPHTGSLEALLEKLDPTLRGIRTWKPGK